jgi:hypothetical protein
MAVKMVPLPAAAMLASFAIFATFSRFGTFGKVGKLGTLATFALVPLASRLPHRPSSSSLGQSPSLHQPAREPLSRLRRERGWGEGRSGEGLRVTVLK